MHANGKRALRGAAGVTLFGLGLVGSGAATLGVAGAATPGGNFRPGPDASACASNGYGINCITATATGGKYYAADVSGSVYAAWGERDVFAGTKASAQNFNTIWGQHAQTGPNDHFGSYDFSFPGGKTGTACGQVTGYSNGIAYHTVAGPLACA